MEQLKFSDLLKTQKINHGKDSLPEALGLTDADIEFGINFIKSLKLNAAKSEVIEMILTLETTTSVKAYLLFTFGLSCGEQKGKMSIIYDLMKIV